MKVKLYKGRNAKGSIDEFSLYFPYPKKYVVECHKEYGHEIKGTFLLCSERTDGSVIRCCWDYLDTSLGYSVYRLGKRYPLESMSKEFQRFAKRMEKLWNDAWKFDDKKHWDRWGQA